MKSNVEKTLYKIGWILLPVMTAFFLLYRYLPFRHIPCMLLYTAGIYCPGCGGTRAVFALLHGHILKALYYHPFVPYCAVLYTWFMISHTLEYLTKGRLSIGLKFRPIYLYIGLGIILANWGLRNLFLSFR